MGDTNGKLSVDFGGGGPAEWWLREPDPEYNDDIPQVNDPGACEAPGPGAPDDTGIEDALRDSHGQVRFAHILARNYADRLLYVHGLGWHHWAGTHWAVDEGDVIAKNAVMDVLRTEWRDAFGDKERAREIVQCERASAINGVLEIAGTLKPLSATVCDLDADSHLLNAANGTVDLRNLRLRPHDPRDRITKVCRAAYRPGERSPEWDAFLERVLPDPEVRGYLARFVGVSLIGESVEQEFTIGCGTGANGKGVFYENVLHALGDYGHAMDSELLTASRHNDGNAPKPALVALRGRRFVVTSETERDVNMAPALMKKLTGGDPITARALHRAPITFDPSHSLMMLTNHLPKVPGNDPAVWRRVRVIPFDVVIPERERDVHLKARLKRDATDAVLTWALAGLADYRARGGMDAPQAVQLATAAYQLDSDAVARFINDRCLINPHEHVAVADLQSAWHEWRREDGADEITMRAFSEELDRLGFAVKDKKVFGKTVRTRFGICLQKVEDTAA